MPRTPFIIPSILRNRWAAFLHDLTWVPLCVWMAFAFRFNFETIPPLFQQGRYAMTLTALAVQSVIFWGFGLYKGNWRFASIPDLARILQAVAAGTLTIAAVLFVWHRSAGVPRSTLLLYPLLLILGLGGPRLIYRWLKDRQWWLAKPDASRALVVGTGEAAALLVRDLFQSRTTLPVGLVTIDGHRRHQEILGLPVVGGVEELPRLIDALDVNLVLVAEPRAPAATLQRVVELGTTTKAPCRILPTLARLAEGHLETQLRPLTVEDLLQRPPVAIDPATLRDSYAGRRVVVTGGGGSIGSELCRQLAALEPECLVVFEHSEFNLYAIEGELRRLFPGLACHGVLGSVTDASRVEALFQRFDPQVVFHAAAYKHVPLLEENPLPGMGNNVLGTRVMAEAAHRHGCERFVLVSTDKAVEPANVMGASKRIAELVVQGLAEHSRCAFITTRFGNVLGSVGSVVPLFKEQIARGGPVTVTHPEITRYFMTIGEAATLILLAGGIGTGGEIFVLDMGEPVAIKDLAEQMIRLSGLRPVEDIPIHYVGLRPGEKLHEQLFHNWERMKPGRHPKLLLADSRPVVWEQIQEELRILEAAVRHGDPATLGRVLRRLVPEFAGKWPEEAPLAKGTAPLAVVDGGMVRRDPEPAPRAAVAAGGAVVAAPPRAQPTAVAYDTPR